ncbi:MAG: hypothetical protein AB7D27_09890, partial [Desulfomicrobium sp.]
RTQWVLKIIQEKQVQYTDIIDLFQVQNVSKLYIQCNFFTDLGNQIIDRFWKSSIIKNSLNIFESTTKTQLELLITKAIYWFSDAHKDKIITMQFIKYWSCIEVFFSIRGKTTQSLSTGISAILTHGPYQFIDKKHYTDIKKKFDDLYDLRSRALHDGNYHNISWREVSYLSQHVSWMLINMITISTQGHNEITQIRKEVEKIDMQLNKTSK